MLTELWPVFNLKPRFDPNTSQDLIQDFDRLHYVNSQKITPHLFFLYPLQLYPLLRKHFLVVFEDQTQILRIIFYLLFRKPQKKLFFQWTVHQGLYPLPPYLAKWTNRDIFLGKYFKKPVKDCEFSERQLIHIYANINIWICRLKQNIFNF